MHIISVLTYEIGRYKRELKQKYIDNAITLEKIFNKAGTLRILIILSAIKEPLRYAVIQELAQLSPSTMNKAMLHLQKYKLIKTVMKEVTKPRKEKVAHYELTRRGKGLAQGWEYQRPVITGFYDMARSLEHEWWKKP